ncbi:MAG: ATPase [Candidatus Cloacimonetes bacterium 4572_55]|nr:MAG: ATPase [Candidatus Cloacimonetes bacterium 4572_55]
MKQRPFWIKRIEHAWKKRSIVWLSGVRRVGKTTLSKMFSTTAYLNCDLPSVVRRLSDPETFYDSLGDWATIVFDEIHRVENPSMLLKIAADSYPHLKILAIGSSTLSATKKFRDGLTGRKVMIFLPPVLWEECQDAFSIKSLDRRLLHGGLPESLLADEVDPIFFSEWIDSFYARDIQELFGVRNRVGFIKLLHLLIRQSSGLTDYSKLAKLSDLSRPTVKAHIEAMTIAHAIYSLPPFHGGSRREIIRRPKCYAFDTGFVAFVKGWERIREEDRGLLWEHLILDFLRTFVHEFDLFYWRDKSGREIDFVIKSTEQRVHALECKINPNDFNPRSLIHFRSLYPHGNNYVICPYISTSYTYSYSYQNTKLSVNFCSLRDLRDYELRIKGFDGN